MSVAKKYDLYKDYDQKTDSDPFVPKAWLSNPYNLLDSMGLGFRENPTQVSYDTLRLMAERDAVVNIVIGTICSMVQNFAHRPKHKYDIGFRVKHKFIEPKDYDDTIRKKIRNLEEWFKFCGQDKNPKRPSLYKFIKQIVTDRLTYDQICIELVRRRDGKIHSLWHVPAYTCRIAYPEQNAREDHGTPPSVATLNREIQYVQVLKNSVITQWNETDFIWDVANPRNTLYGYGYGYSELENLIVTVTSHLWAEEWNRKNFSQGSSLKGVFNFKGPVSKEKLEDFRRQWMLQCAGVSNAHRQMFVNSDGLDFVPMAPPMSEMGFSDWIKYLIQIICSSYKIAPEVCGFDISSGSYGGNTVVNLNEAKLEQSKDKFLRPLLYQLENIFNSNKIIGTLAPDYEFEFYGIDQQSEEKDIELRIKELQSYKTLNEIRLQEGLPPVEEGDVPLNPTYTGYVAQQKMAKQQEEANKLLQAQQGGMEEEGGEEVQEEEPPEEDSPEEESDQESAFDKSLSSSRQRVEKSLLHVSYLEKDLASIMSDIDIL